MFTATELSEVSTMRIFRWKIRIIEQAVSQLANFVIDRRTRYREFYLSFI